MSPEDSEGRPIAADCENVRRWLQVFLDDEMQDREMVYRLAAHLDLCQNCGQEARTFTELKSCLRNLLPPTDPAAVRRLRDFVHSLEDRG